MPARANFLMGAPVGMSSWEGEAVLKRIGWLSTTPEDFQLALLRICQWRWFKPGDVMVMAGDPQSPIIGIAHGTASVITALGPPDTPLTHVSHPGWWIGYVPIVSGLATDNTTVAKSAVFAAVTSQTAIRQLLAERPEWWEQIARVTLFYARVAASIVADLLIRESDRRCAASLLRVADCRFVGADRAIAHVTQNDLAAIANLCRSTASSILGDFEAKGYVARAYNHIDVLNPVALRAMADGDWQT